MYYLKNNIKRLVEFLLEIDVDMAEFSILTPFPHTPVTKKFGEEGRILHQDWSRYTTAEVVYQTTFEGLAAAPHSAPGN